jgi:hypothetical protein
VAQRRGREAGARSWRSPHRAPGHPAPGHTAPASEHSAQGDGRPGALSLRSTHSAPGHPATGARRPLTGHGPELPRQRGAQRPQGRTQRQKLLCLLLSVCLLSVCLSVCSRSQRGAGATEPGACLQVPRAMAQPPRRGRELCEQPAPISWERWQLVHGFLLIVFHLEPRKIFVPQFGFQ